MDDFDFKKSSFSVMNDNNNFVTFVVMVLFGNHRLMFWSFGINEFLGTNSSGQNNNLWFRNKTVKTHVTQSLFSKSRHEFQFPDKLDMVRWKYDVTNKVVQNLKVSKNFLFDNIPLQLQSGSNSRRQTGVLAYPLYCTMHIPEYAALCQVKAMGY